MALTPQEQAQISQAQTQLKAMEGQARAIQASQAAAPLAPQAPAPAPSTGVETSLAGAVSDRLRQNLDIISSIPTATEISLAAEREKLQVSEVAFETGIRAQAERERIRIGEEAERTMASAREMQRGAGPASAFALIDRINKSTESSVRDLDLREKEALAMNQRGVAESLANLKIQELTFNQSARQQAFQNAMGVANLGMQMAQERRLDTQAKQAESSAISQIALKYGLTVQSNETIESITTRAMPTASTVQKLELEKISAEIGRIKSETARANRESGATTAGAELVDFLAAQLESPGTAAEKLAAMNDLTKIYGKDIATIVTKRISERAQPRVWTNEEVLSEFTPLKTQNVNYNEALSKVDSDPRISNKEEAKEIVRNLYGRGKVSGGLFKQTATVPSPTGPKVIDVNIITSSSPEFRSLDPLQKTIIRARELAETERAKREEETIKRFTTPGAIGA